MSFELTILGSSSALPTSKRNTTAHLLKANERFFLIDCGEGTQVQLRKYHLSPARINHIFVSHLHGDHVFGLFGLLSSLGLMGRKADLHLYGPEELKEMLTSHLAFFGPLPFKLLFHLPEPGKVLYEDSKIEVHAIELLHRSSTFGYIFREKAKLRNLNKEKIREYGIGIEEMVRIKKGEDFKTAEGKVIPNHELTLKPYRQRSYAYLSDTAFKPSLAEEIEGVDILYHEATFLESDADLASQTLHSTARQAAEMAKRAGVGKLLIGHISTRYKSEELFLEEAAEVFSDTFLVNDGDVFTVPLRREDDDE